MTTPAPPVGVDQDPARLPHRLYWYTARLNPTTQDPSGIHDGDTLHVVLDMGDFLWKHINLRVANINAPELSAKDGSGQAAKQWAINWFAQNVGLGNSFYVRTHLDPQDKYGRLLAMVYAPNGLCFNKAMVDAGQAVPFEVEDYT